MMANNPSTIHVSASSTHSDKSDSRRSSISSCTDYDILYKETHLWKVKDINKMYRRTYWVDRGNKNLCFGDSKKPFWVPAKSSIPLDKITQVQKGRQSLRWKKISCQVSEEEKRSGRKIDDDINDNSKCFSIHYIGRNNEPQVLELVVPSKRMKHWPDALQSLVNEQKPLCGLPTTLSSEKLLNANYKTGFGACIELHSPQATSTPSRQKDFFVRINGSSGQWSPNQKQKIKLRLNSCGTDSNASMSISTSESGKTDFEESEFSTTSSVSDPASPTEVKLDAENQFKEDSKEDPSTELIPKESVEVTKSGGEQKRIEHIQEKIQISDYDQLPSPKFIPQDTAYKKDKQPTVFQVEIEKHEPKTKDHVIQKESSESLILQPQTVQVAHSKEKHKIVTFRTGLPIINNVDHVNGESDIRQTMAISMDQEEKENEIITIFNEKVLKGSVEVP